MSISKCSVCGHSPIGKIKCPGCGSRRRHRRQWSFFEAWAMKERPQWISGKEKPHVLHVGQERGINSRLNEIADTCLTFGKSTHPRPGVVGDIVCTGFPDNYFHIVWASHVLEHVDDVESAIFEIFRILRHGGCAVLDVPMSFDVKTTRRVPTSNNTHFWIPGHDWFLIYKHAGFIVHNKGATAICLKPGRK